MLEGDLPFWFVVAAAWLLAVPLVRRYEEPQLTVATAEAVCGLALLSPVMSGLRNANGSVLPALTMAALGVITIAAAVYAAVSRHIEHPGGRRIPGRLDPVWIFASVPLAVSVLWENITVIPVVFHYRPWPLSTEASLPSSIATLFAAMFVGQWHVGPAVMKAWKARRRSGLRTILLRGFRDEAAARATRVIMAGLGALGHVRTILDPSLDEHSSSGDPYLDRYISDIQHAPEALDDEWREHVRGMIASADCAVFVLTTEPSAHVAFEYALARSELGIERIVVFRPASMHDTLPGLDECITVSLRPWNLVAGMGLRCRVAVALIRLRRRLLNHGASVKTPA